MSRTSAEGGGMTAGPSRHRTARREARISLWMLAAFAVWTVVFVVASGPVARLIGAPTSGGDVVYLREWVPWTVVTIVWLLPLLVGIGLALDAKRRDGREPLARAGLLANAVIVLAVTGPSLLDRLLHLD